MDHVSQEVRSKIMATVRSKGNRTTELRLARLLCEAGLRGYRRQWPVDGKPDFAWPGLKVAVFVDGCFWHGCPIHRPGCGKPDQQERDARAVVDAAAAGYKPQRIWEHELISYAATKVSK